MWLERCFEDIEVHKVVNALNSEKALDSDGFSMAFFQDSGRWLESIMQVFQDLHASSKFGKKP